MYEKASSKEVGCICLSGQVFFIDGLTQPIDKKAPEFFVILLNNKLELQNISGPCGQLKIP